MSGVLNFGGNGTAGTDATRRQGRGAALLAVLAVLGVATTAPAVVITGGPVYTLPGGGSCTVTNIPSRLTGATVTCTGVNPGIHSNVYFGIRNDSNVNGAATDGTGPSGSEVFAFSTSGGSSITYTGSTTITSANAGNGFGTDTVNTTLTLALSSGSATVVSTGGTPASNGNGAIERLFRITSANFTVEVDLTGSDPHFSGQLCTTVYDGTSVASPGGTCVTKVDLAFYYSDCGDGQTDNTGTNPEQCDLGGSNGLSTSCCTSACAFRGAGLICRTAAGVCDLADTCTGSSATCPADGKSTAQCRGSAGVCDPAENCNGSSNNCPADAKSTSQCRASVGACDLAENCDGTNNNCPADAKSTGTCRAAGGVCDIAEVCDGVADTCPADVKSTAECRATGGVCDIAETCDGVNNACPTNAFVAGGTECRASGGVCDVAEDCTGSSATCPADAKSTAECRAAAGVCDVADSCDGVGDDCPADGKSTAECRASAGVCDAAESCDGVGDDCPTDAKESSSTECRAVAGVCDVAESCDGVGNDCPTDGFESASTECRASVSVCDVAETCTGSGVDCPTDGFAANTVVCRAATPGEVCDLDETCTGSSSVCPPNGGLPDGTVCDDTTYCNGTQTCSGNVCGGGTDPCSMGESCDEATDSCFLGSCPPNAVACRPSDGNKILIKNNPDNTKDKVIWKWSKGAATTAGEFGNPTVGAEYALCFYSGPSAALMEQMSVPPSATKWKAVGTKGYKYNDTTGTADGVTKIIVKAGEGGKAKALLKGKGSSLPPFNTDMPLPPGDLPLIVQLRNNQTGICWEGEFPLPKKNNGDQFNAKSP